MKLKFKKRISLFLIKYFFLVNDSFDHHASFSKVTYFKKIKINLSKFTFLFHIRRLITFVLSIVFFPIAIVMIIFRIKIISANPFTIGNCIEEVECILKRNYLRKKKYKLIFFAPPTISHNQTLPFFFSSHLIVLKSFYWSILIVPLSHYKFCLENAVIKKNDICVFPSQYTNFLNSKKNDQNILSHNIIFEDLLKFQNLNKKEIKFETFFSIEKFKMIKKKYNLANSKFCVLHFRNENIHKTRNVEFKNYLSAINYLINQGYKIFVISNTFKLKNDHIAIINPDDKVFHLDQFYLINYCNLYIGPLSGPWALANLLKKKIILINTVVFNFPIINKNFINLPKKFYFKKNNKRLSVKEIFDNNLECCWNYKELNQKKVYIKENNSNEILKCIKFAFKRRKKFKKFANENFFKKQKFNKYLIVNKIPDWH